MARRNKSRLRHSHSRQKGFFMKRGKRQQKMTSTNFKPATQQKSGRLYALVGFLVLLLAFVAVTFFLITKESRNEQEWIRLSTDLQVHSQQLSKSVSEAVEGKTSAFIQMGDSVGMIADSVTALKNGDPLRSLPALPGAMNDSLSALSQIWSRMEPAANSILEREKLVLEISEASKSFIEVIPAIQELTDEAVRELTRENAPSNQVFVAGRQLVLSDRILRHLKEMLRGGTGSVAAADKFKQEIDYFEQTSDALLQGSRTVGVTQVQNAAAMKALNEARLLYDNARPQLDTVLNASADILVVRAAADEIFIDSLEMFDVSRRVADGILQTIEEHLIRPRLG